MFRFATTKAPLVAAAAGASTSAPTQAHCRAATESPQDAVAKRKGKSLEQDREAEKLGSEWEFAEVFGGQPIRFGAAEITETVNGLLNINPRRGSQPAALTTEQPQATAQAPAPAAALDAAPDAASECGSVESIESFGAQADSFMEQAHAQRGSVHSDASHMLGSMMETLLHNPDVQRSVLLALKTDPAFNDFVLAQQNTHLRLPPAEGQSISFLPAIAMVDLASMPPADMEAEGGAHPLQQVLHTLADNLAKAGEAIKVVADRATANVSAFFLKLGNELRALLRAHFGGHGGAVKDAPGGDAAGNEVEPTDADWWTGAIFSLATAVIAVLVLKRVGVRVAFAGAGVGAAARSRPRRA